MRSARRATPLAAVVVALLSAPAAGAAITASSITDPADPLAATWDFTNGQGPYSLRVAGTATGGGAGESVTVRCEDGAGGVTLADSVPVDNATHAFATFVFVDQIARPCRLRALPTGSQPVDLSPFTGPRVYPTALLDRRVADVGPNSGIRHGFLDHVVTPGRTTNVAFDALGGCGLFDARPLDPAGDPAAGGLDAFACAGFVDDKADGSGPTRSGLLVDGRNAFTGGVQFYSGLADQPGMPELSHSVTLDGATGALKIVESSAVVHCANTVSSYPPADPSACGGMAAANVRYTRTTTTAKDDRSVTVADHWESLDGLPHDLDVLLEMDLASTAYGLQIPWVDAAFRRFTGTASLPGAPSAPGTITVLSDAGVPAGSLAAPAGAIVFASAPTGVEFFDAGAPVSRYPQLRYVRVIPATGGVDIVHTYVFGATLDEVRGLAADAEDALGSPAVAIVSPPRGTRTRHTKLLVTGTSSDNRAVASVTVNGRPTILAANGNWVAKVPIRRGTNRLVAEARDNQGNAVQATLDVVQDRRRPCTVPKVLGLSVKRARKRLSGRRCALGTATPSPRHGYSKRKGRRHVFVRVRRGRVLAQRPKVGSRVAAGTRVNVQTRG